MAAQDEPLAAQAVIDAEVVAEADRLARAERVVGRPFHRRAHLLRALTHKTWVYEHPASAPVGHNEVLEFIGDAVLSLVTVELLVAASPAAQEGELTVRRAAHVSESNLAAAGARADVAALLRVGRGELLHGGATLPSVRADVVEALIGAAYKDGGLDAARVVIATLLGPPPDVAAERGPSSKTVLQERMQSLGALPAYVVTTREGPGRALVFTAAVQVDADVFGRGEGQSKRAATEAAARAALDVVATLDDAALGARLAGPDAAAVTPRPGQRQRKAPTP